MLAAGRPPGRPPTTAVRAVRAVRRRELLRIAAGDLLGAARRRPTVGAGAVRRHRRHPRGDARRRRRGRGRSSAASTRRRPGSRSIAMGRLRRLRAVLRPATPTCCSCTTRVEGADAAGARRRTRTPWPTSCAGCSRCPAPTRRWRSTPTCGPRASRARWCAPSTSYAAYYAKWSQVWEAQALLRADAGRRRRGPAAGGSPSWSTRCATRTAGSADDDVVEVRRIKARVDAERLPRGADPHRTSSSAAGGLADVEWTVQLLQLRHAGRASRAAHHRAPSTRSGRPREAGLLEPDDAQALAAGLAHGQPGPQRGHPGPRQARRPAAARPPRAGRGRRGARLPAGGVRRDGQRLPAHHAARPRRRRPRLLGLIRTPVAGVRWRQFPTRAPRPSALHVDAVPEDGHGRTPTDRCAGASPRAATPIWPARSARAGCSTAGTPGTGRASRSRSSPSPRVWVGLFWLGNSWFQLIIAGFLGVLSTQFGFLGHDAAHRQMFRSAAWNDWTAAGPGRGLRRAELRLVARQAQPAPRRAQPGGQGPGRRRRAPSPSPRRRSPRSARGFTRLVRSVRQGWLFFPLLTLEGLNLHVASVRTAARARRRPAPADRGRRWCIVRLVAFVAVLLLRAAARARPRRSSA